ncbi:hypothetical protein PsorP6_008581 [Peronosclerospora sorghi]|uniref:Uncharacterized protein n=1 Tax=Peronosclerospora sorghi TaxID=230839 RepID=A0ACC0WCM9_9STRA|nr:hypothetical protein PsorP6_008581 [Peronosclerospora sorghi]
MLDHSGQADAMDEMQTIKSKLKTLLQRDYSSFEEMKALIAPLNTDPLSKHLKLLKIRKKQGDDATPSYMDETFSLMFERWDKIYRDFYSAKTDTFNLSKIPDVHDCIKYDLLHNSSVS